MVAPDPSLQLCSGPCHRWLDPDEDFYPGQVYCKDCAKAAHATWKRENYRKQLDPDPARYEVPMVIRPCDLVGLGMIAERLGVKRAQVEYWLRRDERFPLPLARLGLKSPVWDYREIEAYIAKTQTHKRRTQCQT